jgi:hypothetical protein
MRTIRNSVNSSIRYDIYVPAMIRMLPLKNLLQCFQNAYRCDKSFFYHGHQTNGGYKLSLQVASNMVPIKTEEPRVSHKLLNDTFLITYSIRHLYFDLKYNYTRVFRKHWETCECEVGSYYGLNCMRFHRPDDGRSTNFCNFGLLQQSCFLHTRCRHENLKSQFVPPSFQWRHRSLDGRTSNQHLYTAAVDGKTVPCGICSVAQYRLWNTI